MMNSSPALTCAPVGRRPCVTNGKEIESSGRRQVIIEPGEPQTESSERLPDGTFPSREAAELAAVQKAKALIDLR